MAAGGAGSRTRRGTPEPKGGPKTLRFWLTYPGNRIKEPVIWALGRTFALVTNIRQASVTEELGIVCLEISGDGAEIESGIRWLKKKGVSVEPVELNTLEA